MLTLFAADVIIKYHTFIIASIQHLVKKNIYGYNFSYWERGMSQKSKTLRQKDENTEVELHYGTIKILYESSYLNYLLIMHKYRI